MPSQSGRFADLIPDAKLDLRGVPAGARTAAIEAWYDAGNCGAFTTMHSNPQAAAARYLRDEFRDLVGGEGRWRTTDVMPVFSEDEASFGYCASADAATVWKRDRASDAQDWLFAIFQNWGNCVGTSGCEMLQGLQATRAADPANWEAMSYLAANWAYAFRGYRQHGWYGAAHASVTLQHGYCFALPADKFFGTPYDGEQDSEELTSVTWAPNGPPDRYRAFVDDAEWRFAPGAISEFDGDVAAFRDVFRQRGQYHHGSNVTSGSHGLDKLKRIGGHQQTAFGGFWHPAVLDFYASKGYQLTARDDFWVANHQTWGAGWSGEVLPELWVYGLDAKSHVVTWAVAQRMPDDERADLTLIGGPMPQGTWICSASRLLANTEGYVYLPRFRGLQSDDPRPSPPSGITVTGSLKADIPTAIRGALHVKAGDKASTYIIVPKGDGTFVPVEKTT